MEFIRYDKLDDKQVAMIGKWEISEILKRVLERGSCDPEDNLVLTSQEQLEKNVDAYYQAFLKVWNNWRLKFTGGG